MHVVTDASDEEGRERWLDYELSTVPGSRLQVRGAVPSFDTPFVAVLGGSETFGKYAQHPYPALLSERIGMPVANLGVAQAGLSLFSDEQVLLDIASKADLTVLQVLGAQNMSNRLYSVHSRRNDRFLGVSPALRELFPTVDFTEINFTGHLISTLRAASDAAFRSLVEELKWAWVQRMRRVLTLIRSDVLLLWISDPAVTDPSEHPIEREPHFVDADMLSEIEQDCLGTVRVALGKSGSLEGKVFPKQEAEAALRLPGDAEHRKIAEELAPHVARFVGGPGEAADLAEPEDQSFSINSGTAVNRSATRP